MKRKLLIVDTETGGLDAQKHSLLSVSALVWFDGYVHDELHMYINEGDLTLDDEAMAVNQIDLATIRQYGLTPFEAAQRLEQFLLFNDMRGKTTLAGHGVGFDAGFLRRMYRLAVKDFDAVFSHRMLCTHAGALLLDQAGRIDLPGGSASLDTLAEMWNIPLDRTQGHNAGKDAYATVAVLRKLLLYIRSSA